MNKASDAARLWVNEEYWKGNEDAPRSPGFMMVTHPEKEEAFLAGARWLLEEARECSKKNGGHHQMSETKRVIVTRPMVGICGMQVCAVKDATDDEIIAVCNEENPSGTSHGWGHVVRVINDESFFESEKALPVPCKDEPETRVHFLVVC